MARRSTRGMIVAGMAALGMMAAGSREASANLTLNGGVAQGIIQTGGGGHNTDPPYTYQLNINLSGTAEPSNPFDPTTSVTLTGLVGVDSNSVFGQTDLSTYIWFQWVVTVTGHISYTYTVGGETMTEMLPVASVTWNYGSNVTITAPPDPSFLGFLTVQTDPNLYFPAATPPYPSVIPTSVGDSYMLDDNMGPSGSVLQLTQGGISPDISGVPEPSTLIAPLVALLGLGFGRLLKRRG